MPRLGDSKGPMTLLVAVTTLMWGCDALSAVEPSERHGGTGGRVSGGGSGVAGGVPGGFGGAGFGGMGLGGAGGADGGMPQDSSVAALVKASGCDDLLARIQADALEKLDSQAKLLREKYRRRLESSDADASVTSSPTVGGGAADAGTVGSGGGGGGRESLGGGAFGRPHSDTNVQVEGVDEADILETDGEHIYLLHGAELFVLDAWPADETQVQGSTRLEGSPVEMFVADGKAAVFSQLRLDPERPGSASYVDAGAAGGAPCRDCSVRRFTKITLLDVAGSPDPRVVRELYFEGRYISARRHEDRVRAVVQGGFKAPDLFDAHIEHTDAWGDPYALDGIEAQIDAWKQRVAGDIRGTALDDWLAPGLERTGDALEPLDPRCRSFHLPTAGLSDYGMTQVVGLSLDEPDAPLGGAAVLGEVSHVYANSEHLLLAHRDRRWEGWRNWRIGPARSQRTALHLFARNASSTRYRMSGFVPGHIHDQFSLDERDGFVRVSTTQQQLAHPDAEPGTPESWQLTTTAQVAVLAPHEGELTQIASTPLVEDERIYATRFMGDRAYVVTFRRVDPLFVVDLSDPAFPELLGELHIPGFSDYVHPLDGDHLLTIGRDVDPATGRDRGLLLQIFDVSDATDPELAHRHRFDKSGYSAANTDHRAFTYFDDKDRLAFPFASYGSRFRSTLEVFRVDVTDGVSLLGSLDHAGFLQGDCAEAYYGHWVCDYDPRVRRGMFIEDYVYSVSYGGVRVHHVDELEQSVADVPLPRPSTPGGFPRWHIRSPLDGGVDGGTQTWPPHPDAGTSLDAGVAGDPDAG